MALLVTHRVADGKVSLVAVAALAQGLNVFKRCIKRLDMQAANPAGHLTV